MRGRTEESRPRTGRGCIVTESPGRNHSLQTGQALPGGELPGHLLCHRCMP